MVNKKTAKVKITWEFELPVDKSELKDSELLRGLISQQIFDNLVNYSICKHLEDACDYCFEATRKDETDKNRKAKYKSSWKHHKYWADLLRKAQQEQKVSYNITF